jgi:hypothetical protein
LALAALCVAVAGCGGGGVGGLAKRKLVRRAQAICLRAQSAGGEMLPPARGAGLGGMAAYFDKSAAIAAVKTEELRRLRPASGLVGRWSELITAEAAFTDRLESLEQAAAAGQERKLRLIQADTRPGQELIAAAEKLGAHLCAP